MNQNAFSLKEGEEKFFTKDIWFFLLSWACVCLFVFLNFFGSLSENGLYTITGLALSSSFFSLIIVTINFVKIKEKYSYLGSLFLQLSWVILVAILSLMVFEDLFNFSSLYPLLMLGILAAIFSFCSIVATAVNLGKGRLVKLNKFVLFFAVPTTFFCCIACLSLFFLSGAIG